MAVVTTNELCGDGLLAYEPTDVCFYCGKMMTGERFAMWAGAETQIWLHVDCGALLGRALVRDWGNANGYSGEQLTKELRRLYAERKG